MRDCRSLPVFSFALFLSGCATLGARCFDTDTIRPGTAIFWSYETSLEGLNHAHRVAHVRPISAQPASLPRHDRCAHRQRLAGSSPFAAERRDGERRRPIRCRRIVSCACAVPLMFDQVKTVIVAAVPSSPSFRGPRWRAGWWKCRPDFDKFRSILRRRHRPRHLPFGLSPPVRLLKLPLAWLLGLVAASTLLGLGLAWETYRYTISHIQMIPYADNEGGQVERRSTPGAAFDEAGCAGERQASRVAGECHPRWRRTGGRYACASILCPFSSEFCITFLLAQAFLIFGCLAAAWAVSRQVPRPAAR